ncbi:hypothetical protein QCD79_32735, partial [Pseudomonas quasicaspiana]|nr:hypothetical protein [Pseudomonas quasicaspiana]
HGRVLKEDVQVYVKAMMQKAKEAPAGGASGGAGIQPTAEVDFRDWLDARAAACAARWSFLGLLHHGLDVNLHV